MRGMRPLSNEEVEQVLTFLPRTRDKTLFVLGCKSGFRISELLSLKVGDVLFNGRASSHVSVRRCNMKKKMSGRTVPLHPLAGKYIELLVNEKNLRQEDFLFASQKGGAINRTQAWRILDDAFSKADLQGRLGTHCMRKTFADRVYTLLDHDLAKTQKALGHTNINSTVSYLSFREEEIDEAILTI